MAKRLVPARKEAEHIKLLVGAYRSKIALLLVALILTWGLWATLQSGDEKQPTLQSECSKYRKDLLTKWGLSAEIPIRLSSSKIDVYGTLADPNHPQWGKIGPEKWGLFYGELQDEQNRCQQITAAAYLVKIRVPYLLEPVSIDGLELANLWPFVMVAIGSALIVFHLRQRANAIALCWLTFDSPDAPSRQLIHMRSNYRIGLLRRETIHDKLFLVYRPPFIVQPESLIICTLFLLTLYSSFSLEATHRIELSHEMTSVLFDYLSAFWFFSLAILYLVYRTRNYYELSLESLVGCSVTGTAHVWLTGKTSAFLDTPLKNGSETGIYRILARIPSHVVDGLLSLVALGAVFLPWMKPGSIRGYTFLIGAKNLDEGLAGELKYQLCLAVSFVVLCMFRAVFHGRFSEKGFDTLTKRTRTIGLVVIVLLSNLIFHMLVLRLIVFSGLYSFSDFQGRPLIFSDPAVGFVLFSALLICLLPQPSSAK